MSVEATEKQAYRQGRVREGDGLAGTIFRQAPTYELRKHPVSLMLKKTQFYRPTFVANNPSAPHRCLTHPYMSRLLSLETISDSQPCLGHPVTPACLGLQKCFITIIIILVSPLLFQVASASAVWKQCSGLSDPDQ